MDKYRFDDAYQKVYEYSSDARAFIFAGNYEYFGISSEQSDEEKAGLVEDQQYIESEGLRSLTV